jgi:hypothetical protein
MPEQFFLINYNHYSAWEVSSLNLDQVTVYPDNVFCGFPSFCLDECQNHTLKASHECLLPKPHPFNTNDHLPTHSTLYNHYKTSAI